MEDSNNYIIKIDEQLSELNKKMSDIVNSEGMLGSIFKANDIQVDSTEFDFIKNKFTIKGSFKGLTKK